MSYTSYHLYLPADDSAPLFTVISLPHKGERFPTVIFRSPYVDAMQEMDEEEICRQYAQSDEAWLAHGYATVHQHCRGRGRSGGDCVPYIYEREDGLALQAWIRTQPFYNGELYLCGGSYTASVHFVTAPFAPDIKGAVLEKQDCERYNCNYRNGFYKMGLHGGWYVGMYKKKSDLRKSYAPEAYHMLPLHDFSRTVLGEAAKDFDEILRHPDRNDPFWQTRFGGGEAHDAIKHAGIPILLVTGFYDIYTGGVFDMWNGLDDATRSCSALMVHPYGHSAKAAGEPVAFPNAEPKEAFERYEIAWMDYVRGKGHPPVSLGKVTYYPSFGKGWHCDDFAPAQDTLTFPLGEGSCTYRYNPYAPASFRGGLSANFGSNAYQDPPGKRYDILTFYTPAAEQDMCIKGKMTARLCVKSSCEDTCFYIRLSLVTADGDYGLRDDIQQLSNFYPHYTPGEEVTLDFSFDEHAFVIHAGEKLRIDVSSSAFPHYVRHTNRRGLFSEQTTAQIADNTVICDRSVLTLPIRSYQDDDFSTHS